MTGKQAYRLLLQISSGPVWFHFKHATKLIKVEKKKKKKEEVKTLLIASGQTGCCFLHENSLLYSLYKLSRNF